MLRLFRWPEFEPFKRRSIGQMIGVESADRVDEPFEAGGTVKPAPVQGVDGDLEGGHDDDETKDEKLMKEPTTTEPHFG